ncbi:MAG: hypothetical protein NXH88_16215 [Hyphomonas sp.]|nr:hypothetical protein [Hyphomonas sp.]
MQAMSNWSPRHALKTLSARKKELFWVWIAYQSVKGLITTSLIWVPLVLLWLGR